MNRWYPWTFCLALITHSAVALGQSPPPRGEGAGRPEAPASRDAARPEPARPRPEEQERRASRLSPEERRELRQQIHEAGSDVYHRPKPPPH
jgi:hypothetical protein